MTFKMMMNQWVDVSNGADPYFDNMYYLTGFTNLVYYQCTNHLTNDQFYRVAYLGCFM